MSKLAMIGDGDSLLGFKALGVMVYPVRNRTEAISALAQVVKEDYFIVFITEEYLPALEGMIKEAVKDLRPIIVTIPNNRGSRGLGLQRLKRIVEKAVGVDILSGREG